MKWFIADGSQSFGPYSSEQLRAFAKAGKLKPQTMVSNGGDWVTADQVSGLFGDDLAIRSIPVAQAINVPQASTVVMQQAAQGSGGNVVAAVCSFFVPGLGQLAQGRFLAAVAFFFGSILLWLSLLGWVVHLFAAYDAATWGK